MAKLVAMRVASIILNRAWGTPGSEAEVRETDKARMLDDQARKLGRGNAMTSILVDDEPPSDVD